MCTDGWTADDLIYEWKEDEPVQIIEHLNLPRFKLEHYDTDMCNTKTNTGKVETLHQLKFRKLDVSFKYKSKCLLCGNIQRFV